MNRGAVILMAAFALAAASAGIGFWLGTTRSLPPESGSTEEGPAEREPLFYRNPMNPAITSPIPAKDHMGMDYIPVFEKDASSDASPGTVRIDPVTTQSMGVRTARVKKRTLHRSVRASGRIAFDEGNIVRLHPKFEGWVEELLAEETGQQVERGQPLVDIFSPRVVAAQHEYLIALDSLDELGNHSYADIRDGAEKLVSASRSRLIVLGVSEEQVKALEISREVNRLVRIHAPRRGTLMEIGARAGEYVTPKHQLFRIADLSRVWVLVDIHEQDLPWIKEGDTAQMRLQALPVETFRGTVAYIYPYADSVTRTVTARLEFPNPELRLKPEMFAEIDVHAQPKQDALALPEEAIVRSGERLRVLVVENGGKYSPREVKTGLKSDGWTEVLEGLSEGEEVVVSGQFLIDSESSVNEAASKMQEISHDHAHH